MLDFTQSLEPLDVLKTRQPELLRGAARGRWFDDPILDLREQRGPLIFQRFQDVKGQLPIVRAGLDDLEFGL